MASYTYSEHDAGCKCCRLEQGDDLPIPKQLSYDEIAPLARKFSHSIFADWTKLSAILKRFEGVIQKRWNKKGLNQRREILLKAFPDMPTEHRPDFASFRNMRNRKAPKSSTCCSAAFLRPYINLEDLQKHHILLLFLNSRGRNSPRLFLEADIRSAHTGRGWDFLDDAERGPTETSSTMHFDPRSSRSYGRLVLDSTRPDYHAYRTNNYSRMDPDKIWQLSIDYCYPILGLLGLEIQQGVYSFLLACAKLILHDIEHRDFYLAPFAATPSLSLTPKDDWPSLTAPQLEATYCAPQKLDLDRIRVLVASRRASAEDHLWLLKEDPAYFASTFEDWAVHDASLIYHPCSECKQRVVAEMISNSLTSFILWDYIHRKFQVLTSPEKDGYIWTALLETFSEFQMVLLYHITAIQCAPRMRWYYDMLKTPVHLQKKTRNRDTLKDFERRVIVLFHNLLDPDERGHFSDLALISELKFGIEGLRPWAQRWKSNEYKKALPVRVINGVLLELLRLLEKDISDICVVDVDLIGDPSDGRFNYPITKAHTKSNVDQLRYAEGLLDKFWQNIERGVANRSGISIEDILNARMLEPRTLHRTQEWTPSPAPAQSTRALTNISTNIPRISHACEAKPKLEVAKPKEKVKTRGRISSAAEEQQPATDLFEVSNELPIRKVVVPKRTYKVLAALFPGPNAENHQRAEVAWCDFLHALDAIGLQPEKLYGSVWIFRPKATTLIEAKRSIQFHEPKEIRRGGKIPANFVRVFGRRLKHAYGWEGNMFEMK